MKSIITSIAFLITAAAAAAASPITTNDGHLYLEKASCQSGGREASLIETRDNGGGAYGCWVIVGDRIEVVWTTLIGPTGSIMRANIRRSYPAPRELIRGDK